MRKILDKQIIVHDYDIKPSKFGDSDKCLHIQISLNDKKHVVFTGSQYLMDTLERVGKSKLPFTTTIIEEEKRFEFT